MATARVRTRRLRAGLRRHGLTRRPAPLRQLTRSHRLQFRDGNAVQLYGNGHDALAAMLEAIQSARRRIHLETYILRTDTVGRRFVRALTERAREGIDVRLLYDAVGSRGIVEGILDPLRYAGAHVVCFNPLLSRSLWPDFAPRRRDHRKILVVDGHTAFTGGLNIGDEYENGMDEDTPWRDTHVRVQGPSARDLEAVFLESWFRADGPEARWHDVLTEPSEAAGDARCAVVADGPMYRRRRMRDLLIEALATAQRGVALQTPYFAPGRRVLRALAEASRRGIAVELMLAGQSDHPVLRRAARSFLPRLLARGVRVSEYDRGMLHAKVGVFDDEWAIVGSSNLDRQSFELSYEVNLVIEGGGVAAELRLAFERDREGSVRLDTDTLARRGWIERGVDRMAAWVHFFY